MSKTSLYASDTIVAAATPMGNSGVGIVRISGSLSLAIANKFFEKPAKLPNRMAVHTKIKFENIHDDVLVIYFQSPNSFTGEDVVEFHCHGGALLVQKIIEQTIKFGARLAQPGEFSRRAVMNGKLSLDQAEAIINVINAESNAELTAASNFLTGEFADKMKQIERTLIEMSAQIEATLDHPEEIAHDVAANTGALATIIAELNSFTDTVATSNYIYNGIRVAILGRPNVGKSSLFNALLGTSRSIVTQIAGTTTDTVSETAQINGFKIRFLDTAGLRKGKNQIEKMGIERTRNAAENCDIALVVLDATQPVSKEEIAIIQMVQSKPHIIIYNKSDLCPTAAHAMTNAIEASALTGQNIEKIKDQIVALTVGNSAALGSRAVANARQINELNKASVALVSAANTPSPDCVASDIQTALFHIGNITGTNATEAVLDEIFSRFCLGK